MWDMRGTVATRADSVVAVIISGGLRGDVVELVASFGV